MTTSGIREASEGSPCEVSGVAEPPGMTSVRQGASGAKSVRVSRHGAPLQACISGRVFFF